jgi:hypothetical protein
VLETDGAVVSRWRWRAKGREEESREGVVAGGCGVNEQVTWVLQSQLQMLVGSKMHKCTDPFESHIHSLHVRPVWHVFPDRRR